MSIHKRMGPGSGKLLYFFFCISPDFRDFIVRSAVPQNLKNLRKGPQRVSELGSGPHNVLLQVE